MLKAIETSYKGYRFRSRLEARWAVFFDALGVAWEYEKEGYDLGDAGWYLPDFWLPASYDRNDALGVWVEIKGDVPTSNEQDRCCSLAKQSEHSVICLIGQPLTYDESSFGVPANTDILHRADGHYQWTWFNPDTVGWDNEMRIHRCEQCNAVKFEFDNYYYSCPICKVDTCTPHDDRITKAVMIARSARFEHGERP